MGSDAFQRKYNEKVLIASALLTLGVAGIAADTAYFRKGILLLAGAAVLGLGILILAHAAAYKKLLDSLGINDAALERFKQEKKEGCVQFSFGQTIFTENWICQNFDFSPALFPLAEVEFFEKHYRSSRYGSTFYIRLVFPAGKYDIACDFENQEKIMALLRERCPQAKEQEAQRFFP